MYRVSKIETGKQIRKLMKANGVTVREIQEEMDLESPQAVYKWLNGRSLPSTENLLFLAKLLRVPMEEMLVLESQCAYEREKELQWTKDHPPVFLAYRFCKTNLVRKADAERFSSLIEDLAQERLRSLTCAH